MTNDTERDANASYRGRGPLVIDEGDRCEHCEHEISLGNSVHLIEMSHSIEEWCRQCAEEVRQRV